MHTLFNIWTRIFDGLLWPFRNLAPVWGVAFLALLTAIFVLYIYKVVSNQSAIKRLKKRIQGYFLGIYLFRDDLGLILGSQARVFSNVLRYMGHSLLPFAVVLIPILLVCVQMQLRYGYSRLSPGDIVPVSIQLSDEAKAIGEGVELLSSEGLTVETPPLRIAALNEIDWRIRVNDYGMHEVTFKIGGAEIRKGVDAVTSVRSVYPVREKSAILAALLCPGEPPIEGALPVKRVEVGYGHSTMGFLGLQLHWSIVYFLLAVVFGIILKRFFKVDF